MLQRSGGLMYVAGFDGDFTDDPRIVARLPGVFAPPKEQPFLIDSVMFHDPYDGTGFPSTSRRASGFGKYADVDRTVSPKSHVLQRLFTNGLTVTSVRIRARLSDAGTEIVEYAMHGAYIMSMGHDPGNMVSTEITATESMRFGFQQWEARVYN